MRCGPYCNGGGAAGHGPRVNGSDQRWSGPFLCAKYVRYSELWTINREYRQSLMIENLGQVLARTIFAMLAILCVVQQTVIGLVAIVIANFPLKHREQTAPWSGPIIKAVAAIALLAFSFYLCRKTVRSLLSRQAVASNAGKTVLGMFYLVFGAYFTVAGIWFVSFITLSSHGDLREGPTYWAPIIVAGGSLLIFSVLCWLYWIVARALS
jgi:hypothetical protein